jgi:hypothetical protein
MRTTTTLKLAALTAAAAVVTTGALVATSGASGSAAPSSPTRVVDSSRVSPVGGGHDIETPRLVRIGGTDSAVSDGAVSDTPRLRSQRLDISQRELDVIRFEPLMSPIGAVTPATSSMESYLTSAVLNVHKFWQASFAVSNLKSPQVRYIWPVKGQSFQHGNTCGTSGDDALYYCPADDTIVISQELARNLWEGRWSNRTGAAAADFGVALFVAHEYAHNVQHELGLSGTEKAEEVHADCLAGVWARYSANILDAGDIQEGVAALTLLRDERTVGQTHGNAAERTQAFSTGYNSGLPVTCTQTYLGG